MTYRVYHPETAEPFDVPRHRFDDLVLNKGWTQSPPSIQADASEDAEDAEDNFKDEPEELESKPWIKKPKRGRKKPSLDTFTDPDE